ncbi:MAG: ABC transporter substrate-binding protein [Clostridiales bacterium]|nr:ABC transporter substrate-binding protein [Clostridiales bacterium]
MNYHIDTIPVWEAIELDSECLLCALHRRLETGEVERYLGASVMEPDTRIQVNEKGFCGHHQAMLYAVSNRLGHALMLQSHLTETRQKLQKTLHHVEKTARHASSASLLDKLSGKEPSPKKALAPCVGEVEKLLSTCIVCDSIKSNMQRYLLTFFHLYKHEKDFRKRFEASKGVCLSHAAELLRLAPDYLSGDELADFAKTLCRLENEAMDRMQEELDWFIKKFDYRFAKEPWNNSRDAVERTVNKLRGWSVGQEPFPKE